MPTKRNKRATESYSYEYLESVSQLSQFNIDDYIQNAPMIKKLNEERESARITIRKLSEMLEEMRLAYQTLELQKKELEGHLEKADHKVTELEYNKTMINNELRNYKTKFEQLQISHHNTDHDLTIANERLQEARRSSFIQLLVSIIASVTLAVGVNILTTTPTNGIGILLVAISVGLSAVAFFIARKSK